MRQLHHLRADGEGALALMLSDTEAGNERVGGLHCEDTGTRLCQRVSLSKCKQIGPYIVNRDPQRNADTVFLYW